jgi:hypothetical protein
MVIDRCTLREMEAEKRGKAGQGAANAEMRRPAREFLILRAA